MIRDKKTLAFGAAAALVTAVTMNAGVAFAQDAASAAAGLEEVTVSARRRDESIVDVPLAITVVSAKQLESLGITSTKDLANYVPGLEFNDFTPGYSRNDRGGARALVFRGLALGLGAAGVGVTSAGSMFLDGAAVVGNEVPAGMDVGAVEVLRGPQSVYFGRSTMTGAVAYRTKEIPEEWGVDTALEVAQRDTYRVEASVAGRIASGLLGLRLTGLTEEQGGYVTNAFNGDKLGDRTRDSLSATLDFKPTEAFEAKLYVNEFKDDDGPAATAFLPAQFSSYQVIPGAIPMVGGTGTLLPTGCNPASPVVPPCVPTRFTFNGELPSPSNSINYSNTTIPTNFSNAIFASSLLNGEGFERKLGMQRNVLNSHLNLNWKLNDYLTLSSITGYHTNATLQAADGIGQAPTVFFSNSLYFYTITNKSEDLSTELRLSSDPEQAFSWAVGANYVDAFAKVQAIVAFQNQVAGTGVQTNFLPIPQAVGIEQAKTAGFFAGGYFKLLDEKMTISAEGRYQQDNRGNEQFSGATGARLLDLSDKFTSFNPRIAVDYAVGDGQKLYASYATGTRPGGFNGTLKARLDTDPPAVVAQINQFLGIVSVPYDEEKLKVFEVGFKGNLASGKGYFDLNAYVGKLEDQQVPFGALIPLLGFTVTAVQNIGETEIRGVEWQGNYRFNEQWSLSTTAAWNHAERTRFVNTAGYALAGTNIYDGKKMANAPEISGSAVLSYQQPVMNGFDFFSNLAAFYRGKQYMDGFNLAYIPGRAQVDLRLGVARDNLRVELYALNLADDTGYTGGNVATDFGGPGDAATTTGGTSGGFSTRRFAFFGGTAPPRQVGLRLNYSF